MAKAGMRLQLGQYAFALALVTPVVLFTNLQLAQIQATDAREEFPFSVYFRLRLVTIGAAVVALTGASIFLRLDRQLAIVVLLVAGSKGVDAISDILFGLFQRLQVLKFVGLTQMMNGLVSLLGGVLGAAIVHSVIAVAVGSLFGSTVSMLLVAAPAARAFNRRRPTSVIRSTGRLGRRLLWMALPLGGVMALLSLNANIPRYFIESQLGTSALGLYAVTAYVLVAPALLTTAIGQTISPQLARLFAAGDADEYARLTGQFVLVGIVVLIIGEIVAIWGGAQALTLVYGPEYAAGATLLLVLVLAGGLGIAASAVGYAVTAARRYAVQLPLVASTVAVAVVGSAWSVPRFGLIGAGWTAVAVALTGFVAYGSVFLYLWWDLRRRDTTIPLAPNE